MQEFMRDDRYPKILSILGSLFIMLALITITSTAPSSGYEISIYNAYPWYFWVFIVASLACGISVLLYQAFAEEKSHWMAGLIIIMLANSIFLLLPEVRGYALYGRGDALTHLGFIRDILTAGHVGGSNFYPIVHILGTTLIKIAGFPLESIASFLIVLFSSIYIVNIHLLARVTSNYFSKALLITAFASPLIYSFYHVIIHPGILSLFMIPCLLYIYQRREKLPYDQHKNTVLLFLLALSITFFHPVTTVFLMLVFLNFGLVRNLYSRFLSHKASIDRSIDRQYERVGRNFLGPTFIVSIAFLTWYFPYSSIQGSFKAVYDWLVYQIGTPLIQTMLEPLAEANLTSSQTFELFINRYGAIFLSLLISGTASIHVLNKILSKKHNVEPMKFTYAMLFCIALLLGVAMLLGYFVEYNLVRVARFSLLIGPIVSGLVISDFTNSYPRKNVSRRKGWLEKSSTKIAIGAVILIMVALSLGNVYGSPRVCAFNHQITQMEIAGTNWFGRSKNLEVTIFANNPEQIHRFEHYNFGVDFSPIARTKVVERVPSHFGYDQIAETLNFQDRYLLIFELDRLAPLFFPENVRPKVHQYVEEDFVKLNSDPRVAKLYCNGEFEVWRVYGDSEGAGQA